MGRRVLQPAPVIGQVHQMRAGVLVLVQLAIGEMRFERAVPGLEGGQRIALDGELPINTGGGQLSAGRLRGFGHIHEACVQLWGLGGQRQVPNDPKVAVVCNGAYGLGSLLLVKES